MVSIIVPAYNVENYLDAAVNSVLAQTCGDWELILVDDGSTDSSGSMCDAAASRSKKIRVIHKANGGLSSARNAGLDIASGHFILFLDADDILSPIALETFLSIAISSNADIVCADIHKFNSSESLISTTRGMRPSYLRKKNIRSKEFSPEGAVKEILYQKSIDNSAPGKIYKRRLWEGIRFREGIGYEDLDLFYHIFLRASSIAAVGTPLYYYRQHPASYLHKFSLRRADVLDVTSRLSEFMKTNYPTLLDSALSRQLSANFNILGLITANSASLCNDKKARDIADECWEKIKELRGKCLRNPSVRLKNKIAIALSYIGGRALIESLSPIMYR